MIGKVKLPSKDHSLIKAVTLSTCGNFGFLGTSSGWIDKYNMQSGLHRRSIQAHKKPITAIACDNTNRLIISGSLDHTVKFWDFENGCLIDFIQFESSISTFTLHSDSRLLAIVTDDMNIRVVDIDSRKIVRVYKGHTKRITGIVLAN